MRIAVVGSGIAGLTCAHVLGEQHDITLFEADERLGGHANTVEVDDPEAGALGVDTGFIVHNDRNYPNFQRLLAELGVAAQDTEMSFAVTDRTSGFSYRATNLNTLFAKRSNIVNPTMWRMLIDIFRDGVARYGDRAQSDDIIRRLEEATGLDITAPGFPAEMVDDEPEEPGYEVVARQV